MDPLLPPPSVYKYLPPSLGVSLDSAPHPHQNPPIRRSMSISPDDDHRSPPCPSPRAIPLYPSPSHGPSQAPGEPSGLAAAGSGRAPAPTAVEGAAVASPGSSVAAQDDSFDSSDIATDNGLLDAKKDAQNNKLVPRSERTGKRGGLSSQLRSDQVRFAPTNGRPSGPPNLVHSDHFAGGSDGFEYNAAQSAGRRNHLVNGNHLLNFYYDPVPRPQPRGPPPPRRQRKIRPYNKDLFLQANFKFIVLDSGNYQNESMDPDRMLQWEDVICVRYSTSSPVQCPICLEDPLCPQITSCGHIYCFPCILQYMLMGEEDHKGESWKKCPLCFMMISTKDLYTIKIDNVNQYNVGELASFTLLTRAKDSLEPSLKYQLEAGSMMNSSDYLSDSFSKFLLTSDVELSVREARLELNSWLGKAESGVVDDLERLPYVCAALEQLEERMKYWTEHRKSSNSPVRNRSPPDSSFSFADTGNKSKAVSSDNKANFGAQERTSGKLIAGLKHGSGESSGKTCPQGCLDSVASSTGSLTIPEKLLSNDEGSGSERNSRTCKDSMEKDSYTFYQSIDGQRLILHPLNMKCLLHYYGSCDMLPSRITGVILDLESVTQSEAMRRRFRFLSHFSLTTTFQFCEIDLTDILPSGSLEPFMDEIKKREKQRKRLAKKEQEEKAKAEVAALHESHIASTERYSRYDEAIFSPEDFEVLGTTTPSTSPPVINERTSFSSVTRLGFAAAHDSPSLKAEESTESSRMAEETGETSTQDGRSRTTLSFANIISMAKSAASADTDRVAGLGKKGKKPSRVLLSTAGGRRY